MALGWEVAANAVNALSIVLAARNSIHTWWTGILGCLLFGVVFAGARLYADATLQVFFIITSVLGWRAWRGTAGHELPIRNVTAGVFVGLGALAFICAAGYALLLLRFTNAAAPFVDSMVLTFSILAQLLLMRRFYQTWWCWLAVNTIAVPLFLSRGLIITACLYAAFWVNAILALGRWRRISAA